MTRYALPPMHQAALRRGMRAACLLAGAALAGCTVGPDYVPPPPAAPAAWFGPATQPAAEAVAAAGTQPATQPAMQPATQPAAEPSVTVAEAAALGQWWRSFNDPTLAGLVEEALKANLDVKVAESRVRQARASRGVVSAGLWPSLQASGGYSRSRGTSRDVDLFRTGLDAAWELDVFGGTRRDVEAAEADTLSAVETRNGVLVSLAAEVATDYLDLRIAQRRLEIVRKTLITQRHSATVTHQKAAGGFASASDVASADADVASTEAQIPAFEALVQQTIFSLSVLLARQPAALQRDLEAPARIPAVPPRVPVGLPSDLLRRRPDIRLVEAQIHAATARIGVAQADLFPKFSLTGSGGLQASALAGLGKWDNRSWSIGPTVTWQIFDGWRIRSNIEVKTEDQRQALFTYEKTILIALQDVETALDAYAREQQRGKALATAAASNRKALDLATLLYTEGQGEFLNVLIAQRSLYSSEDAVVQNQGAIATDLVALYKALGGGWEDAPLGPATPPAGMER